MRKIEYQSGQSLGECTYLHEAPPYVNISKNGVIERHRKAAFKCKCGNEFISHIDFVKRLKVRSCGCLQKKMLGDRMRTHGLGKTKLYEVWSLMKSRCYSETDTSFRNYGGRGITVCDEWLHDFKKFHGHVTKLPHYGEPNYSIDRKDNDGNYEPGNVRWATKHQQAVNKRIYKNNKTGYVGISPKYGRFLARIRINTVLIYLGLHGTPEKAVTARNNYIIENNLTEYKIQEIKK